MVRKFMLAMLCLAALAFSLPVFAQEATETPMTEWTCPEGFAGQTLSLYNWTTYIAEDTVPNFRRLCSGVALDTALDDPSITVQVEEDFFGSNEDLIARLRQGNPGYDIVVPTGNFIPQMVREGQLEPLDLSKIPNFANVSEFLKAPAYDPENLYSIPYQWGTIGVGYNLEAVGKEITSWEDVWSYTGNVAWLEDPRMMLGVALHLLGYDPNSTNADEIAEARDYLLERGSNVRAIAVDDGQEKLLSGEVDIVIEYSGDIFQIIADCEANPDQGCDGKFAFSLPSEGTVKWVDNLTIAAGAPNPDLAHAFIDYVLDAKVGADISNYTAYASPNQAAIDAGLILPELLEDPIIYPSEEISATLFDLIDVGDAAQLYNDAWTELRVLLGQ